MKCLRVCYPEPKKVEVIESELEPLSEGRVLVETEVSLMSTGTENIILNALFDPGTHWANFVKFPYYPGYSTVGVVRELGPGATRLKVGDRVVFPHAHRSWHVPTDEEPIVVPPHVSPEDAAWFALARITHNGARNVGFDLGDSVAVIGAGPIGQMVLRWAVCAGAQHVVAIDPVPLRLDIARKGGATHTIAATAEDALEPLRDHLGGVLPRTVADTTGFAEVFPHALKLTRTLGRLLLIGDTGSPASQHLTPDVVTRGISVIGAHYMNTYLDRTVPQIFELFWALVTDGRFRMEGMVTHTFKGTDAPEAYRLVNQNRGWTVGVMFDWRGR